MELQEKARKAFYNALRRGKTSVYNYHQDDAQTLMAEMKEFAEASEDMKSEHLPEYTEAQEELADIIIGCMTELFKRGVNIEKIIDAKIAFNEKRILEKL
jgi:NTP pyrophosphatase (non-canonical NTP hydrolase)